MQSALRRTSRAFLARHQQRALTTAAADAATAGGGASLLPEIHVLRLDHLRLPIASQLRIEEALLRGRTSKQTNYFLVNQPPPTEKTVVMGISNKTELLVHLDAAEADRVQLLRRFSGGGTVFIDENCFMATMIINRNEDEDAATADAAAATAVLPPPMPVLHAGLDFEGVRALPGVVHPSTLLTYPNRLMDWTRDFYAPVFSPPSSGTRATPSAGVSGSSFSLTGSDYCFGHRKFGGNAQTITKRRWLHHTSFLWTLDSLGRISRYLQVPAKQPEYRRGRAHGDFLVSLQDVWHEVAPAVATPAAAPFEESNAPSDDPLFQSGDAPSDVSAAASSSDARVPPALASRMVWRLSHFFRLRYPPLEEIVHLVKQYEAEAPTAIKVLDYRQERARIQAQEEAKRATEQMAAAAAAEGGKAPA